MANQLYDSHVVTHVYWVAPIVLHQARLFNKSTAVFYDVKKGSKLKWNHEPQASGFTA